MSEIPSFLLRAVQQQAHLRGCMGLVRLYKGIDLRRPLSASLTHQGSIVAVYMIVPPAEDPVPAMSPSIDNAVVKHCAEQTGFLSVNNSKEGSPLQIG